MTKPIAFTSAACDGGDHSDKPCRYLREGEAVFHERCELQLYPSTSADEGPVKQPFTVAEAHRRLTASRQGEKSHCKD